MVQLRDSAGPTEDECSSECSLSAVKVGDTGGLLGPCSAVPSFGLPPAVTGVEVVRVARDPPHFSCLRGARLDGCCGDWTSGVMLTGMKGDPVVNSVHLMCFLFS